MYLLVGVLGLLSLLFSLVSELCEPLEEQWIRAGGQGAFPTQPGWFRSLHSLSICQQVRMMITTCLDVRYRNSLYTYIFKKNTSKSKANKANVL